MTSTGNSASKLTGEAADALSTDDHSKLQWLATVRTDRLFPTKELARGLAAPTVEHQQQLKHLLRYLKGTTDYALKLKPSHQLSQLPTKLELITLSDSDWAGCRVTRKSTLVH